jgi:uncharacterized protein (DUF2141 family)
MKVLGTLLFLTLMLSSAVAQTGTATLQGIVLKAGTTEPLAEATVALGPVGGRPRYTAVTDERGQFVFSNVDPGSYLLAANRIGYLPLDTKQFSSTSRAPLVTLTAGQQMRDTRLQLTETGAISGRIIDRDGQPLPNAQIQALRYGYDETGRRVLKTVRAVPTDDLGQYRIFWLPPGQYVLMAKPLRGGLTNQLVDMMPGGGTATRMFGEPTGEPIIAADYQDAIPLFFPGTTTAQRATAIDVRPGSNVRGIDFAFTPLPAYRVKGVVTGIPVFNDPRGFPGTRLVAIEPQGESMLDDRSSPRRMATINPTTSTFEFSAIAPGSYFVSASASVSNAPSVRTRIPIEVVASDLDNVSLQLTTQPDVQGVVIIEDVPAGTPAPSPARMYIRMQPDVTAATPQANGNFALRGVRSGDYRLWPTQVPEGAYVKSIRLGDSDITNSSFRVDASPVGPISVILSMKAATITASVVDAQGKANPEVVVALVPDAPRRGQLGLYKNGFTDAAGSFKFTSVAPGSYKVFAWRDVEENAWKNAEFLGRAEDTGIAIRVEESANSTLKVTLP